MSVSYIGIEKKFNDGLVIYNYILAISKDNYISQTDANSIFDIIFDDILLLYYGNNAEILDGIKFYNNIYNKIKEIDNYDKIIELITFLDNNDNSKYKFSIHNIVDALMKICNNRINQISNELMLCI
jgi:hypothetical protein